MMALVRRDKTGEESEGEIGKLVEKTATLLLEVLSNLRNMVAWALENKIPIYYAFAVPEDGKYSKFLEATKSITENYEDHLFRVDGFPYADEEGIKGRSDN